MPSARWFRVENHGSPLNKSSGVKKKEGLEKLSFSIDKFTREVDQAKLQVFNACDLIEWKEVKNPRKEETNRDECVDEMEKQRREKEEDEEKRKRERKRLCERVRERERRSICRVVASRWLLVGQVDAWLWDLGCLIPPRNVGAIQPTLFHFTHAVKIFLSFSQHGICSLIVSALFHSLWYFIWYSLHSQEPTHQKVYYLYKKKKNFYLSFLSLKKKLIMLIKFYSFVFNSLVLLFYNILRFSLLLIL